MKKVLLLLALLISFSSLIAQNKISLVLKDGNVISGIGRIKIDEQILFRSSKGAEKELYNYKTVKSMTIYTDDSEQNYVYKIVEETAGVGSIKLLEIIAVGKVILYKDFASGMTYSPNMNGEFGFTSYSKTTYYISNLGEDTVTNVRIGNTYSGRFKKIANKYFSSCPDLLDKIKTKHFNRYGIESVVNYYNKDCN